MNERRSGSVGQRDGRRGIHVQKTHARSLRSEGFHERGADARRTARDQDGAFLERTISDRIVGCIHGGAHCVGSNRGVGNPATSTSVPYTPPPAPVASRAVVTNNVFKPRPPNAGMVGHCTGTGNSASNLPVGS